MLAVRLPGTQQPRQEMGMRPGRRRAAFRRDRLVHLDPREAREATRCGLAATSAPASARPAASSGVPAARRSVAASAGSAVCTQNANAEPRPRSKRTVRSPGVLRLDRGRAR